MKAEQLIYTGCDVLKVWSSSKKVTDEEVVTATRVMGIRDLIGLPYYATQEQIAAIPKKYAYFELPTGRKCIAMSTYVHYYYSESEGRVSNYFMHALMFDDLGDVNPYKIFGNEVLRSGLTYEEWHDDPSPSFLPEIEVETNDEKSIEAIQRYLKSNKKESFLALLQAIVDAAGKQEEIFIHEDEDHKQDLFVAIGTLLPKKILEKVSFCTYQYARNNAMSGTFIQLLTYSKDDQFNEQEGMIYGKTIFNFENGNHTTVESGRYIKELSKLSEGSSIFELLKTVEEVDQIVHMSGCTVDEAIAIDRINSENAQWFRDKEEFLQALHTAQEHRLVEPSSTAQMIRSQVLATNLWGKGSAVRPLVEYVYRWLDDQVRHQIINQYFSEPLQYGVTEGNDLSAYLKSYKANAPFPWDDFVKYILDDQKWENNLNLYDSLFKLIPIFDAMAYAYGNASDEERKEKPFRIMTRIVEKASEKCNLENLKFYFEVASSYEKDHSSALKMRLIDIAIDHILLLPKKNGNIIEFAIKIATFSDNNLKKAQLIEKVVTPELENSDLVPIFCVFERQMPEVFKAIQFSDEVKNSDRYHNFLIRKEIYSFGIDQNITFEKLEKYYDKYFIKDLDHGEFSRKCNQFISCLHEDQRVEAALKIYRLIATSMPENNKAVGIANSMNIQIFTESLEWLLKNTQYRGEIEELNRKLQQAGVTIPENFAVYHLVLWMREISPEDVGSAIQNDAMYTNLNEWQLRKISDTYMGDILSFYLSVSQRKLAERDAALCAVFDPLLAFDFDATKERLIECLKKIKEKEHVAFVADVMAFACNHKSEGKLLYRFVKAYMDSLSRGQSKSLFKKVIHKVPASESAEVQKEMDAYFAAHRSIFDKIFNKKKGEK